MSCKNFLIKFYFYNYIYFSGDPRRAPNVYLILLLSKKENLMRFNLWFPRKITTLIYFHKNIFFQMFSWTLGSWNGSLAENWNLVFIYFFFLYMTRNWRTHLGKSNQRKNLMGNLFDFFSRFSFDVAGFRAFLFHYKRSRITFNLKKNSKSVF